MLHHSQLLIEVFYYNSVFFMHLSICIYHCLLGMFLLSFSHFSNLLKTLPQLFAINIHLWTRDSTTYLAQKLHGQLQQAQVVVLTFTVSPLCCFRYCLFFALYYVNPCFRFRLSRNTISAAMWVGILPDLSSPVCFDPCVCFACRLL